MISIDIQSYIQTELSHMIAFNPKSTYLIVHKSFQFALEITEDSFEKKAMVELGPVNENNYKQLWIINGRSAESVELVNGFSDYCLTEDGEKPILKRGTGSKHQSWTVEFTGEGQDVQLKLSKSKNKYLGVNNGELVLKQGKFQNFVDVWTLVEVSSNEMIKKTCFLISTDTKKLIDIPEASKKQGEKLIIHQPNYRYNQRWNIYKAGEIYVIKSFFNKMNMDVESGTYQHENPIVQFPSHGGANQFWRFERLDQQRPIYRIYTCYDKELELGHGNTHLKLIKGRKFTWQIQGFFPE